MATAFHRFDDAQVARLLTDFGAEWALRAETVTFERAVLGTEFVFTRPESDGPFPTCTIEPQFSTRANYGVPDEFVGYEVMYKTDFGPKNEYVVNNAQPTRALKDAQTLCNGKPTIASTGIAELDHLWHTAPDGLFEALADEVERFVTDEFEQIGDDATLSRAKIEEYVMDGSGTNSLVARLVQDCWIDTADAPWVSTAIQVCDSPEELRALSK